MLKMYLELKNYCENKSCNTPCKAIRRKIRTVISPGDIKLITEKLGRRNNYCLALYGMGDVSKYPFQQLDFRQSTAKMIYTIISTDFDKVNISSSSRIKLIARFMNREDLAVISNCRTQYIKAISVVNSKRLINYTSGDLKAVGLPIRLYPEKGDVNKSLAIIQKQFPGYLADKYAEGYQYPMCSCEPIPPECNEVFEIFISGLEDGDKLIGRHQFEGRNFPLTNELLGRIGLSVSSG